MGVAESVGGCTDLRQVGFCRGADGGMEGGCRGLCWWGSGSRTWGSRMFWNNPHSWRSCWCCIIASAWNASLQGGIVFTMWNAHCTGMRHGQCSSLRWRSGAVGVCLGSADYVILSRYGCSGNWSFGRIEQGRRPLLLETKLRTITNQIIGHRFY